MIKNSQNAFIKTVAVFILLFSLLLSVIIVFDFSTTSKDYLIFLMFLLACFLIARNIYYKFLREENKVNYLEYNHKFDENNNNQLYLSLYKSSPVPHLIIDSYGHVTSANVAAVRVLGLKQLDISGLNIFDKLQSDKSNKVDLLLEKYRQNVSVSNETFKIVNNKKEVWVLLSLYNLKDAKGKKMGIMTLVDITNQKKIETSKTEFVSLVSHQLRTPISGMKWSAELLLIDNPGNLTEKQVKYINRLIFSIEKLSALVDDFLRVSRFEVGNFKPEYKRVDIGNLLKDILSEFNSVIAVKDITLNKNFHNSSQKIVTDPNLIRIIVTNLVSNAIKYTNEGGVVSFSCVNKNNKDLVITVADTGIGIPMSDQSYIFSKLFRAQNAVRNVPDGTGLGLYIVREAVSILKGKISFTTAENLGTTFRVVLPVKLSFEDL